MGVRRCEVVWMTVLSYTFSSRILASGSTGAISTSFSMLEVPGAAPPNHEGGKKEAEKRI